MNAAQIRADLIAQANERIVELRNAQKALRNVILGQGYVVLSDIGMALNFEVDPTTKEVKNPTSAGGAHKAVRFTKQDAENIAAAVIDGNGKPGKAVHILDALRDSIVDQEKLIETIRATGPVAGE